MDSVNIFTCMGLNEPHVWNTGMVPPLTAASFTSLSPTFKVTSVLSGANRLQMKNILFFNPAVNYTYIIRRAYQTMQFDTSFVLL